MSKKSVFIRATFLITFFYLTGFAFSQIPKIEMIFVEGGTYLMGSNDSDASYVEKPVHQVSVDDFYIGKYEVTQAQWQAVMGNNPSKYKGSNLPVENVCWKDVQEFISKLNALTGKKYRLPTEAEWEYAARGGRKSLGYKYSGGAYLVDVGWYKGNSFDKTHKVGYKIPNELGIHDMTGNVSEWCSDWWGSFNSGKQTNPQGALSGTCRVLRGGNYGCIPFYCRLTDRSINIYPDVRYSIIGFRLASSSSSNNEQKR